jgi:PiT family inorganic phosphate transporter
MPPHLAVAWSGMWNFIGVMLASGAVAFGIVALLPVELILQVSAGAGFAMVFALLIAAILWNLGTWYLGLPSSSSHALIGSVIGVGFTNQLMAAGGTNTSGVDWTQAISVGKSLFFSPLIGFSAAAFLLLIAMKAVPVEKLYKPPRGKTPPPLWIRSLLIFTCTGVSFAHGSNDGQKGMGLIMLILIGTVPTVYALNRTVDISYTPTFVEASSKSEAVFQRHSTDHHHSDGPAADHRRVPSHPRGSPRHITGSSRVKRHCSHTDCLLCHRRPDTDGTDLQCAQRHVPAGGISALDGQKPRTGLFKIGQRHVAPL